MDLFAYFLFITQILDYSHFIRAFPDLSKWTSGPCCTYSYTLYFFFVVLTAICSYVFIVGLPL